MKQPPNNMNKLENLKESVALDFEKIAKLVPLIIGFLIICGSLYLDTYYRCFHINIFNYLDTTEILTTFLYIIKDIIFIFAGLIGYMIALKIIFWIGDNFPAKNKKDSNEPTSKTKTNLIDRFVQSDEMPTILTIVSLVFCLGYIMKSYEIEINSNYIIKNKDWMGTALIIFTAIASLLILIQFETGKKAALKNMSIFFALFFISYSVSTAVEKIEATVNRVDKESMVILENDTLKTTSKYIYVGRTNRYVFFFDTEKERADVIPQDQVKRISFSYQKP